MTISQANTWKKKKKTKKELFNMPPKHGHPKKEIV